MHLSPHTPAFSWKVAVLSGMKTSFLLSMPVQAVRQRWSWRVQQQKVKFCWTTCSSCWSEPGLSPLCLSGFNYPRPLKVSARRRSICRKSGTLWTMTRGLDGIILHWITSSDNRAALVTTLLVKLCCHPCEQLISIVITVLASTTVDLYFLHYFHLDSSEVV